ncbi:hypothetical protein Poli38472_013797 [Pythium oligandrum]|uniref:WRKY19-like zinc finger domain-containing protein n=1 Tax=Pythium oligandrum TaxID=41045 RepID=A0A8K1F9A8_PYTOL|nr:hypothetical protein Poli38472_013797 [Pythium oligandrum]|eukprot:TMW55035.1 hypothetical protein Poli38472_013797 [Pythium oligandrum]
MTQNAATIPSTTDVLRRENAPESANPALLLNMMECVDTSLFSQQQLHNWEQMKAHIKTAAEQNLPVSMPISVATLSSLPTKSNGADSATTRPPSTTGEAENIDFRQPLHREASIQDVLSCLLDQQPPSQRVINSNGSNVLLNSEIKNRTATQSEDHRPTLKSLLSSNDFTMTEKKESLKHLLSFIDNSFASHPEPMTDVYKESQEGSLRRLSSLHLMRSFLVPPNTQAMGRTTSFEIIQAMLNATSNQVIQKPMTSQDSFRFQHLANVLEAVETDVGYDNEDYGNEEVVQVDNLDNLLDYQSPTGAQSASAASSSNGGFVDTQNLFQRPTGGFGQSFPSNPTGLNGFPTYASMDNTASQMYGTQMATPSYGAAGGMDQSGLGMMAAMAGQSPHNGMMYQQMKPESQTPQSQHLLPSAMGTPQQHQAYNQMSFQASMLAPPPAPLLNPVSQGYAHAGQSNLQHQQLNAILMQQQHTPHHERDAMLHSSGQVKQSKQEVQGGVQICSALGCNHVARVKGMCKLHGGGRRCKVEGCMKSAQTGHLCIAHGGGKPCSVDGCPKTAQSRGLCKQHGGGVRCKFEGCTKSCQSGGFCRGHGGGKRCEFPNCTKWAQKNGHCAKHAQEITQGAHRP